MKNNLAVRKAQVDKFKGELQVGIRTLRKERGLTQKQFGAILGVDQATISNFESGKTVMSILQAYEVALVFGKDFTAPRLTMSNQLSSAR
ncbi:helix-turn-helix transcriptional regulator [Pseudoalteromonas sp. JBTF-M23]|uniref:Helix-turn-helix transcriptional regulator n=1 Tax=Pseudoalteromonas caenipelagi TaxID=2726988 RepID=A0A849VEY2_9GAMM|nr:helix-turn-helix transcriptional regulator [Pseudoalteromonas caenipelagi]NOU51715.1 helix-turn-helix transcriptional regulator [Pseudoalteromonas caenipelagi]